MPTTRSGATSGVPSPPSTGAAAPSPERVVTEDYAVIGAAAPSTEPLPPLPGALTAPLDDSLSRMEDAEIALRDAASIAITQVWRDARSQTSALAQKINEGNTSLSRKLNESFSASLTPLVSLARVVRITQRLFCPFQQKNVNFMSRHKKCAHGELSQHGTSWRSTNELMFEFPSAPFGCCTEHKLAIPNCYLVETVVHARHGEETPESAAEDLRSLSLQGWFMCLGRRLGDHLDTRARRELSLRSRFLR
ncbi:hypothetical protein COOONC_11288 [Cooperia oncophora]